MEKSDYYNLLKTWQPGCCHLEPLVVGMMQAVIESGQPAAAVLDEARALLAAFDEARAWGQPQARQPAQVIMFAASSIKHERRGIL
jgi:hypothetical protein